MACPTSRYRTLITESQRLTDKAVSRVRMRKKGNARTAQLGTIPYQIISPRRKTKDTAKSISPERLAQTGKRSRGKYTFVIRFAFPATLSVLWLSDLAKYVQGIRPA